MFKHFFENKYPYLILAFIIIILVIEIIIHKESYDPDLLGTLSDWVMVAVTVVTGWFIWRTLNSQKEVQKASNRLLEIENARHKAEVKPVFELIPRSTETTDGEYVNLFNEIQLKNISNFEARNFKISDAYSQTLFKTNLDKIKMTTVLPGNPFTFITTARSKLRIGESLSYHASIEYNITYSDLYGNYYKQALKFYKHYGHGNGWELTPSKSGYFEDAKWKDSVGHG